MKVGFVIRRNCPRCARIVTRVVELLPKDWELVFQKEISKFTEFKGVEIEQMQCDIIISVGGDGTVLWTLQYASGPILGINMGGLGFLSEIEIGDVESAIYRLKRKEYTIDRSRKLRVRLNEKDLISATNEVLIHSAKIAKIRKFTIFTENSFIDRIAADGVIVATPTGSTSYSYSAGGPILYPSLEAMVISYIAPFASRSRPIVIPEEEDIRIKLVGKDQSCRIIVDGQTEYEMNSGDELRIGKSEEFAEFVTLKRTFFERVREKLVKNVVD